MKKQLLKLLLLGLTSSMFAQYTNIVEDNFADRSKFFDVSLTNKWAPFNDYVTAFKIENVADKNSLAFDAISLTKVAGENKKYNITDGLRESTAFDYIFNEFDRTNNEFKVEFDLLWKYLSSGGQDRRFVVALVYDYPENGIKNDMIDSVNAEAPYGRPAYNFRVFNRTSQGTNNYANIFYGGGQDLLGEFEKFGSDFWLPGFISGPGGISPENSDQFPLGPANKWMDSPVADLDVWTHFTLIVTDTTLKYYARPSSEDPANDVEIGDYYSPAINGDTATTIAKLNNYYGTSITEFPANYKKFNKWEAVRFFFNGDSTYVSNISIDAMDYSGVGIVEKENESEQVNIFPSIASDFVNVEISGQANLKVFSITGSLVKEQIIKKGNTTINVSDLKKGLYIFKLNNESRKIIVK